MPLNDYGFLGKEIDVFRSQIAEKYNELLIFYRETNHVLQKLKFNLKPKLSDDRKIAIVVLFNRALETFQSIYILCSYGLVNDAECLNRVLFETVVKILYCSEGEDSYKRYIATDLRNKIKSITIMKNNPKAYPKEIFREDLLNSRKIELEAMLKEMGEPSPLSIDVMARKTGMANMYDSFFIVASETVHTSPRILEDYVAIDEKENIKVMWGPRIEGINVQLFAAIEIMLCSCQRLSEVFGKPKREEINSLNEKKVSIYQKYTEKR